MEYENIEVVESPTEDSSSSSESVQESTEVVSSEEVEILESDETEAHDRTDEYSVVAEDHEESVEEVEEVEEKPSSTIVQYLENEEGGLELTELDVNSLNIMSQSYVENMLAVQPGTTDYSESNVLNDKHDNH